MCCRFRHFAPSEAALLNRVRRAYRAISPITLITPLTLVDIGAAGGIQPKWRKHRRQTRSVMFEPNPVAAARLRAAPDTLVIEHGLAAEAGAYTLNVAHWMGCSSLLDADPETLAGYQIAPLYVAERRVSVECARYDELHRAGQVPAPDAIKVDVEGYEYQVLAGFGDLLGGVLGIEAEAWFYPVFKGQKLLHDLVALLASFDLRLRRIEKVPGFEGDMVCVNAFFTRGKARRPALTPEQQPKFALLERVWALDTI
ncbi:MAG TPA: FkbM family methyltransferase [Stellaceae bacterium]|jgi:FkbM family methyltransferase|nr:FkbM family methyltransferase [Stellaceae bacterium]